MKAAGSAARVASIPKGNYGATLLRNKRPIGEFYMLFDRRRTVQDLPFLLILYDQASAVDVKLRVERSGAMNGTIDLVKGCRAPVASNTKLAAKDVKALKAGLGKQTAAGFTNVYIEVGPNRLGRVIPFNCNPCPVVPPPPPRAR